MDGSVLHESASLHLFSGLGAFSRTHEEYGDYKQEGLAGCFALTVRYDTIRFTYILDPPACRLYLIHAVPTAISHSTFRVTWGV